MQDPDSKRQERKTSRVKAIQLNTNLMTSVSIAKQPSLQRSMQRSECPSHGLAVAPVVEPSHSLDGVALVWRAWLCGGGALDEVS
jgi:hypothetical protein